MTRREQARPRPRWWWSAVAGASVAAFVLLVGGVLLAMRPDKWSANASVVVLPSRTLDPGSAAGYYETLSRGQMVETIAEIIRLPQFARASEDQLGLSRAERAKVSIAVGVIPNTALISVTVTAGTPSAAESLANQVLDRAGAYLRGLDSPYVTNSVSSASGTAKRSGLSRASLLVALLIGALAVGLAVQQLAHQLVVRPRGQPDTRSPDGHAPPYLPQPARVPATEAAGIRDGGPQSPDGNPGLQPVGPWSEP